MEIRCIFEKLPAFSKNWLLFLKNLFFSNNRPVVGESGFFCGKSGFHIQKNSSYVLIQEICLSFSYDFWFYIPFYFLAFIAYKLFIKAIRTAWTTPHNRHRTRTDFANQQNAKWAWRTISKNFAIFSPKLLLCLLNCRKWAGNNLQHLVILLLSFSLLCCSILGHLFLFFLWWFRIFSGLWLSFLIFGLVNGRCLYNSQSLKNV